MSGGELLLINPRKRRGRKSSKRRARRRNPARRIRARSRKRHVSRARRRNPVRSYRSRARRRRRNPLGLGSLRGTGGSLLNQATNALMGAGGAVLNDVLIGYVPLPAMLKTGPMAILAKFAGAFAVGYGASFALGKARAARMTEGALTVLAYQVVKPMVATVLPLAGTDIEGLGYYSPGMILQDSLSPLPDLNQGTPLAAYISGLGGGEYTGGGGTVREGDIYDPSIDAYIS